MNRGTLKSETSTLEEKMKRSLSIRINVIIVCVTTLILMIFGCYETVQTRSKLRNDLAISLSIISERLASSLVTSLWEFNNVSTETMVTIEMRDRNVFAIVVKDSVNKATIVNKTRGENWQIVDGRAGAAMAADGLITVTHPIVKEGEVLGAVEVYLSDRFVNARIARDITIRIAILMILLASIIVTLTFVVAFNVSRPVKSLMDSFEVIAAGNLDGEIKTARGDEIGRLAKSFALLRDEIKRKIADLNDEVEDHNRAEQALRKEQEFIEIVLNSQQDAFFLFEPATGKAVRWNKAFSNVTGYTDAEIEKMTAPGAYTSAEDMERAELFMKNTIAMGTNKIELKLRCKDGSTIPMEYNVSVVENDEGEPVYLASIGRNITERKQAERALAQEKERLLVTLRSIADGVITTDTSGRLVMMNKVAEQLTGWEQHDAVGKDIREVFHTVDAHTRKVCENPVEKALSLKAVETPVEHTLLITRDGAERMISESGAPIFDAKGETIGAVLVFRDVTEKHQVEKKLQQAQKIESVGILAGGIAHDFNNLLGVITGNISYALSQLTQDNSLFSVLSDVQESAKQAQALTHQLLTFARGGAPVKKVTDLNQIVRESAQFVTRGGKVRCDFILAKNLSAVEVDPGQISQSINNLIINANQAMPDGGIIEVRTENTTVVTDEYISVDLPEGDYVKIIVKDQGIGISEKQLPKIFDPYFTTKQRGSGLGLASVYSIIKKHNGEVTVNSEIDSGTTFTLYLPASSKALIKKERKTEPKHRGKGRILIMDDQETILAMTGRMLEYMGYEAAFATDGAEAVFLYQKALQEGRGFDLVILDLTVPGGMGGAGTIPELLKIDPDVKAVVSSGYSNDPIMANFQDYGFCGVVPKPFTVADLASLLSKIFDRND